MENKSKSVGIRYLYTDENGAKSVKPLPLKIMLPEMKTWGASESSFNPGDWSMSMQITESTPVEVVAIFEALDNRIVDYVFEKSKQLLGNQKSKEIIKEFMTQTVRPSVDKVTGETKSNNFKVKLTHYDEKWGFFVCNENHETIFNRDSTGTPDTVIPKYSMCDVLVSVPSIWVSSNKFGYTLRLVQIVVAPGEKKISLYDTCVLPKRAPRQSRPQISDDLDEEEEFGLKPAASASDMSY